MLKSLFGSRKFVTGLIAVLAVVLIKAIGVEVGTADAISKTIITMAALYIGGTALEDAGAKFLATPKDDKPADGTPK